MQASQKCNASLHALVIKQGHRSIIAFSLAVEGPHKGIPAQVFRHLWWQEARFIVFREAAFIRDPSFQDEQVIHG